ncbi:hypothetical protein H8S95_01360 [Pontibacter sp. KCTC 32443]|uniref:hypothetical protein n=1 Tax=Pontibacter TaxID=323449 RepID=UPI00164E9D8A|nr:MULTISPECIES: hypothetical protein [Pontibacter]MBC5772696.1 hypothetical protein [Pontibacter sp. KCTC 32443]
MMNWIVKALAKYGAISVVVFGFMLITLGLALRYRGVEVTQYHNSRSAFNNEINSGGSTPTDTLFLIGAALIVFGFKKRWIVKK